MAIYTIDINDKASSKLRSLSSTLAATDQSVNRLGASFKSVTVSSLTGKINELRGLRDNVDIGSSAFKKLNSEIGSAEKKLASLSNQSGIAGIAFGALAYGGMRLFTGGLKTAIAAQTELEQATAKFAVFMDSTFKAKKFVDWATQYANVTPLLRRDILRTSETLLQYGVKEGQVQKAIKSLGDISGGDAHKLQSLGLAYGQVKAAGALRGQELLQMVNAGYNPLQTMSETTGKSLALLRQEMSKGMISFQMIADIFEKDTAAGGRFHGMLEKMSQTVGGKLSTLADAYNTKMATMGVRFQSLTKWGIEFLTSLINTKGALEAITIAVGAFTVVMAVAALKATAFGTAMMATSASLLTNPYVLAAAAIVALGVAIYNTTAKYNELAFSVEKANAAIVETGNKLTGIGQEKDITQKVAFENNRRRLQVLENQIANTTGAKQQEAIAGKAAVLAEQQKVADYYFNKYAKAKVGGRDTLNAIFGRTPVETGELMQQDPGKFFGNLKQQQQKIAETIGTKTRLDVIQAYLDKQNLTDEQRAALRQDNPLLIHAAFGKTIRRTGWKEEHETRLSTPIGGLPSRYVQDTHELEMKGKALEHQLLRQKQAALGATSFDSFLDKEESTESKAAAEGAVNHLKSGIVSGGSRTTNIYIQPKKALLNIEQWLGDSQEKVVETGNKVAEVLDRVLSSFVPSSMN